MQCFSCELPGMCKWYVSYWVHWPSTSELETEANLTALKFLFTAKVNGEKCLRHLSSLAVQYRKGERKSDASKMEEHKELHNNATADLCGTTAHSKESDKQTFVKVKVFQAGILNLSSNP
jgi:hypothetical protein